jgi:glycine betaine/proline transport system substrate-binding protein
VKRETEGVQIPQVTTNGGAPELCLAAEVCASASSPSSSLQADYERAERVGTKEAWEAFLARHGDKTDSFYVQLAEAALKKLAVGVNSNTPEDGRPTTGVAAQKPGEGKYIEMARATWDTGWFQAEIYKQLFEALGYHVGQVRKLDNPPFYQAVGQGDIDLWVNGWFPLHDTYDFQTDAQKIGYVAKGGGLQGYFVDKRSAEEYGITNIMDFKKPEIKEAFDSNGDGKADLVACPPGWGCEKKISEDLNELGLHEHINPIKAGYSSSMAEALRRYKQGDPILFYTWTPNWMVGILRPGYEALWIEMPNATEDETAEIEGCEDNPCQIGFVVNDIRPVANKEFLNENPAVKELLEKARIPLAVINAQIVRMNTGENSPEDIERHASEWIENNRNLVSGWLEAAREAAM